MKLKNNTANFIFISLIISAFIYGASIIVLSPKILSSAFMQLVFLIQNHYVIPVNFWSNIITGLMLLSAYYLLIRAIFLTVGQITTTHIFLKHLIIIRKSHFILHKSSSFQAFTAGFLHPHIYLSSTLLKKCNPAEFKAILFHETCHRANHDPLKDIIVNFIKLTLPPFPYKTVLFERYFTATEITADTYALQHSDRFSLVSALTKVLNSSEKVSPISANYFSGTKARFQVLTGVSTFSLKNSILGTLVFALLIVFATTQLSHSSLFVECKHLADCFYSLVKPVSVHPIVNNLPHCHDDQYVLHL